MRNYSDKALRSFFGAREGGQNRPQNINTPQFLIDAILELWPEGIELDPCSNVESKVPARHKIIAKEVDGNLYLIGSPKYPFIKDGGLSVQWPDLTYANPPYDTLKRWLQKPVPGREHLMLAPCRPNRKWYCRGIANFALVCWLKSFPFDGHTSCYPTPLGLYYWGTRLRGFYEIFSQYGEIGRFVLYHDAVPN